LTQKEVTVLHELSVELGATLNLQGTFSTIACKIARIVPFTSCVLYLYSEATGRLVAECAAGEGADVLKNNSMDYGANISGWSVAQREPVMNADASLDLERLQDKLAIPLKTVLVCPLVFEGKVLGTISLYAAKEIKFKDDDLRIMSSITQKAAPAIQNALKYEEAQVEAAVDPLTSLPNVRYLRQFFAQVMNESLKSRHPLCVLVMDLDGFKAVNDFYGHQAGDRLLVEMSNVLRRTVRESDLVVRHGGDEFVAVLLRTTRHDAAEMASRIQREVDNRAFEVTPGRSVSVGISIGSASWPEDGNSLEELLHAADAAMYSDKRNRASQNRGALRR
jgi:diguanylate cyclase (GGDEF)-like protein